jgi:hypothetical protein
MNLSELPLQLSTLGLIGFMGSILRGYRRNGFDVDAIIGGIIWHVGLTLMITVIIVWLLSSSENKFLEKKYSSIIIFTWIYFITGFFSIIQLAIGI